MQTSEPAKKSVFKIDTSTRVYAPIIAIGLVLGWSRVVEQLGVNVYRSGPQAFCYLLFLCALILSAKFVNPLRTVDPAGWLNKVACLVAIVVTIPAMYAHWRILSITYNQPPGSDFSYNTWTAEQHFFDAKQNPYTTRNEIAFDPTGSPHVTKVGKQLYMFGVPYYFGYPYFPATFITYEPLRRIAPTRSDYRMANAIFYIVTLGAIAWLTALLTPQGWRTLGALLAISALTWSEFVGHQFFFEGLTDVIIPIFAIFGFIAVYYKHPSLAGVLFGWSFACKLLPGAFFCLIMMGWFWHRPDRWKFIAPLIATFAIVVIPFLVANPPGFISATVLYYLTEHAAGDGTALYFYLPPAVQPIFLLVGLVLVAFLLVRTVMNKSLTLLEAVARSFMIFVVFMAFSKMAHGNYLLSVLPLGCIALAAYALKPTLPQAEPAAASSAPEASPCLQCPHKSKRQGGLKDQRMTTSSFSALSVMPQPKGEPSNLKQ